MEVDQGTVYTTFATGLLLSGPDTTDSFWNANILLKSNYIRPSSIEIDPLQGKLYFVEEGIRRIWRANLDFTGVEALLSSPKLLSHLKFSLIYIFILSSLERCVVLERVYQQPHRC